MVEAVAEERLSGIAADALLASGAVGQRHYAIDQVLAVRSDGRWLDAKVVGSGNVLRVDGDQQQLNISLNPWNHAPRELPCSVFEDVYDHYARTLRAEHSHIVDALSGRRLDVLAQCVAIEVVGTGDAGIREAEGLAVWLDATYAKCCEGGELLQPAACALLTGPPAAGKTSLLSQVLVRSLDHAGAGLVLGSCPS